MGYSKHSLPRLGRCCVPLRGMATRRLFAAIQDWVLHLPRKSSRNRSEQPPTAGRLCSPSVRLCAPSFGLALSGYSPIIAGAVPGLCGGMEGGKRAKEKPPTAGRLCALLIHFQKLCKDNQRKSDNAKDNQHFLTPLNEGEPLRRGGFGKPISNGGGVLFQCGCVNAG